MSSLERVGEFKGQDCTGYKGVIFFTGFEQKHNINHEIKLKGSTI